MSGLAGIATSALHRELFHRDEGGGWDGGRYFKGIATGEIRREEARRKRARPRGPDGKLLVPIRAGFSDADRAADVAGRLRWSTQLVVLSWGREYEHDEPAEWPCVWCHVGVARGQDHALCYDCRLRESALRKRE